MRPLFFCPFAEPLLTWFCQNDWAVFGNGHRVLKVGAPGFVFGVDAVAVAIVVEEHICTAHVYNRFNGVDVSNFNKWSGAGSAEVGDGWFFMYRVPYTVTTKYLDY